MSDTRSDLAHMPPEEAIRMQLNISYNAWIRTTQSDHEALVCSFLQRVKDKGDIYKDTYEGYYCIGCEKYMDEEEMDDKHVCKTHKTMCELRKEENYFFRLSRSVTLKAPLPI